MKDVADLLGAIGSLLWPLLAVAFLVVLLPTLRTVFRTRPFTVKVGSFELSAQAATDNLARQVEDLQRQIIALTPDGSAEAVSTASSAVREDVADSWGLRILWVDDHPENNAFEIAHIEGVGAEVTAVRSTREALDRLRTDPSVYQVLVSDMGRQEGLRYLADAGLRTVRHARGEGFTGPAVIYTSPSAVNRYSVQA
jgi:CheY-like chemotaxis protein